MKYEVVNLKNIKVSQVDLSDRIWCCDVRTDIISRVIRWQQAKRQQGTHASKTVSQISGTTKKPFRQKGTGNARQGSLRSVQMRGGAVAHGPTNRSHAIKLQKKVRNLGLRSILSDKAKSSNLIVADKLELESAKTKAAAGILSNLGDSSILFVEKCTASPNFVKAVRNLDKISCLPVEGLNVYDVARHEKLVVSLEALAEIEERL